MLTVFNGQGAYELAYQAGFRFELCDDAIELNRVMVPTQESLVSEHGVPLFVAGQLAGSGIWRDNVSRGDAIGREIAQKIQQTGNA